MAHWLGMLPLLLLAAFVSGNVEETPVLLAEDLSGDTTTVINNLNRSPCKPECLFAIDRVDQILPKVELNFVTWSATTIKNTLHMNLEKFGVETARWSRVGNLLKTAENACQRFPCRTNMKIVGLKVKHLVQRARDTSDVTLGLILQAIKSINVAVREPDKWKSVENQCKSTADSIKKNFDALILEADKVKDRVSDEGYLDVKGYEVRVLSNAKKNDDQTFRELKSELNEAERKATLKCKWSDLTLVRSDKSRTNEISDQLTRQYNQYLAGLSSAIHSLINLKTMLINQKELWHKIEWFISKKLMIEEGYDKLLHDNRYRATKAGLMWMILGQLCSTMFNKLRTVAINPMTPSTQQYFIQEKQSTIIAEASRLRQYTRELMSDLSARGRNRRVNSCGGQVRGGVIKYPRTGTYGNRQHCRWVINTRGRPFVLKFRRFDLEANNQCSYDWVQQEGGSSKWCGKNKPTELTSEDGNMVLVFRSDGSVVKSGFEAEIVFVNSACGGKLSSGVIRYPASGNYQNSKDCTWRIDTCGRPYVLTFSRLNLESESKCGYDYVRMRTGSTSLTGSERKYCGTTNPGITTSTSSHGVVNFRSDGSTAYTGFEAEIFVRGDMEYKIFTNPMKFHDAEKTCEEWGGNLASVISYAENQHLLSLVQQRSIRCVWIGYTDRKGEGEP